MEQRNKLYVSIDALLDLRLGVMNAISPRFAAMVTTQAAYFQREEDRFSTLEHGELPPETLTQVLKSQGKKILPAALRTKIGKFLKQLCAVHFHQMIKEGWEMSVEIDINLYPYVFTEDEVVALHEVLTLYLGRTFKFNLLNVPPKNMVLDQVRDAYFGMVMYDYAEWVNCHNTELQKKPLRDTCLYLPRLFFGNLDEARNKITARAEIADMRKNKQDPFEMFRQALGPFLSVQYLPVAFFSADIPENLAVYTDPVR